MLRFKHGAKSFEVVKSLLDAVFGARAGLTVVDLTYGVGRFYRLVRHRVGRLIGVDVARYRWEVAPDEFYLMPCQRFVEDVLAGRVPLGSVDVVVVDPPWSSTKRGTPARGLGISSMPYHLSVDPESIVLAAARLARALGTYLLYRYRRPLPYEHVVRAEAEVVIMNSRGVVYYGVCKVN